MAAGIAIGSVLLADLLEAADRVRLQTPLILYVEVRIRYYVVRENEVVAIGSDTARL